MFGHYFHLPITSLTLTTLSGFHLGGWGRNFFFPPWRKFSELVGGGGRAGLLLPLSMNPWRWLGLGLGLRSNVFACRVTVTGIYRATPLRVNPRQRTVRAVYKTYIDVIHFRKADSNRLRGREEEQQEEEEVDMEKKFSSERKEQLRSMSLLPHIYERLSKALGKL